MRPSQLLAAVLAMTSVSAAMPDAFIEKYGLSEVKDIFARQDDNSSPASEQQSSNQPTRTTPPESARPSATNNDNNNNNQNNDNNNNNNQNNDNKDNNNNNNNNNNDNNNNNNNDNKDNNSDKASVTGSQRPAGSRTTGKPKTTSYDNRLPAGGISLITPNALAGAQFYKVGEFVTFAWNFTSVSHTPSAVDILASCTANQATYTIAVNQSADQTQVVWDTKNTPSGQAPFLTEKYTLLIYDSDTSVSAAPRAGYLAAFSSFTFGMYTPQPYVPFDKFECANCNGALSQFERMTLQAILLTTGTTIGSLAYFTYTFGLW